MMSSPTAIVAIFLAICLVISTSESTELKLKHARQVSADEVEEVKQQSSVALTYFSDGKDEHWKELFFLQYDEAAETLKNYQLSVFLVDCTVEKQNRTYCDMKDVGNDLIAFRHGTEQMRLPVDTMMWSHAIVANILMLEKYEDFPIISNSKERETYLVKKAKGHFDLVLTYQDATGSKDHFVFMEAAYGYPGLLKFGYSNEKAAFKGLGSSTEWKANKATSVIWILRCKDVHDEETACDSFEYKGRMDAGELHSVFKMWTLPRLHKIPEDGATDIYTSVENDWNVVYVCYDDSTVGDMEAIVGDVEDTFAGVTAITAVNLAKVKESDKMSYCGSSQHVPSIGLRVRHDSDRVFSAKKVTSETVSDFLITHLKKYMEVYPENDESDYNPSSAEDYFMDEDDEVQKVTKPKDFVRKFNMLKVATLTDKTFTATVKDTSKNVVLVLFSLYYDARSAAFLPNFASASVKLADNADVLLTRVDCFDWTDVCAKENITAYPTLRVYKHGQLVGSGGLMLDEQSVIDAAEVYKYPTPLHLMSQAEVYVFIDEKSRELSSIARNAYVLGLFNSEEESEEYKLMSEAMIGKHVFGLATGDVARARQERDTQGPSILVVKNYDQLYPREWLHDIAGLSMDMLAERVNKAAQHSMPELTMYNLPELRKRSDKFVIVFGDKGPESTDFIKTVAEVSHDGSYPDLVFAHMDTKSKIGPSILFTYDSQPSLPALIYVDYHLGVIHSCKEYELNSKVVIATWLGAIKDGKLEPTNKLAEFEWGPGGPAYDFIGAIMKTIKRKARKREPPKDFGDPADLVEFDAQSADNMAEELKELPLRAPPVEKDEDDIRDSRLYRKAAKHHTEHHHAHTEL